MSTRPEGWEDSYEWAADRWHAVGPQPAWHRRPRGVIEPGRGPVGLAQEMVTKPWQAILACMLLNRTRRQQAHRALWRVLRVWPTEFDLVHAPLIELADAIRECGFQLRRAESIKRMADDVASQAVVDWLDHEELAEFHIHLMERPVHGMGRYALESWQLITMGDLDAVPEPQDHELRAWRDWADVHLRDGGTAAREASERRRE